MFDKYRDVLTTQIADKTTALTSATNMLNEVGFDLPHSLNSSQLLKFFFAVYLQLMVFERVEINFTTLVEVLVSVMIPEIFYEVGMGKKKGKMIPHSSENFLGLYNF